MTTKDTKKRPFEPEAPPGAWRGHEAGEGANATVEYGAAEKKQKAAEKYKDVQTVVAQLRTSDGECEAGPPVELPLDITPAQLTKLLNDLLSNEDPQPYSFYIDEAEILKKLRDTVEDKNASVEEVLSIIYVPQAVFRVRAVTRCTATLEGHSDAVVAVVFSPSGNTLATGSGDATVRLWDLSTELPHHQMRGHKNWILCLAFSPDGKWLASGSMDGEVRIWDPVTGKGRGGGALKAHKKWVTALAWEPLHSSQDSKWRLASASKDHKATVWDVNNGRVACSLSGHTAAVTALKWGGQGLIFTGSQDRTVKVWAADGKLVRTLQGHGHWVNTLALSTDFVLRTGAFDHHGTCPATHAERVVKAQERYNTVVKTCPERLVSGSDDFTMFMWDPSEGKKPITRMTGHVQLVNHVVFSPNGLFVASASFDRSVRLWDGSTGKFIAAMRGHVQAVYQVCWSADSRLLLSGSKDSTLKLWDVATKKQKLELPGHADEVFAVDWSPDGQKVASGGKDRVLKMWRH